MDNKLVQRVLAYAGLYTGSIDRLMYERSQTAITNALRSAPAPIRALAVDNPRRGIAAVQMILKERGFYPGIVDGYAGNLTNGALVEWEHLVNYGKPLNLETRQDDLLLPRPVKGDILTESECIKLFGTPGERGTVNKYLKTVTVPYKLRLGYRPSTGVSRITMHEKVVGRVLLVLEDTERAYGQAGIEKYRLNMYDGSYYARRMRGGTSWSKHAFGIASDWDALNNSLTMTFKQSAFSRPEYTDWMAIWRQHGFLNYGEVKNYDSMHFEIRRGIVS